MGAEQLIYISLKLGLGGISAVFAIAAWSKTRESPWFFVVLGILCLYAETIYSILGILGFTGDFFMINSISAASLVFSALPPFFFIIAFVLVIIKKSHI
ncbi:MAG: hypothetical protein LBD07_05850 [Spirochaetaceae bacterium]|jgi:hypothetical protein|nr:hypothetical protein [Spirochaetaceae bacterium]